MARHSGLLLFSIIMMLTSIIFPALAGNIENIKSELQEESNSIANGGTLRNRNIGYYPKGRHSLYDTNGPKMLENVRSKVPIELEFLVGNIEDDDRLKRFDDYGHMRFGKRGGDEQFDDYGHMRFGRRA